MSCVDRPRVCPKTSTSCYFSIVDAISGRSSFLTLAKIPSNFDEIRSHPLTRPNIRSNSSKFDHKSSKLYYIPIQNSRTLPPDGLLWLPKGVPGLSWDALGTLPWRRGRVPRCSWDVFGTPRMDQERFLGNLECPEWVPGLFLVDFGINFRVRFCSDFDRSSIHAGRNLIGWGAHLYRFIPSTDRSPWSNFLIKIDAQICDLCFLSFTFMFQASFRSPTKIHDQICDLGFLSFSFLVQAPFRSPPMDIGGS